MQRLLCICVLFLFTSPLQAEDGPMGEQDMDMPAPRGFVDLTHATVMGSPGVPGALISHLPGGKAPQPISWPLPKGPVLLLGLPAHDDVAFDVAEALGLIEDPDELAGGYRAWAWESDGRAIAVVLAADRSALFATRFLFEAAARPEALNPSMRQVNMQGGDGEAAVWMRMGHVAKKSTAAVRAWIPNRAMRRADWFAAVGAHANEVWIWPSQNVTPWKAAVEAMDMGIEIYRLDLHRKKATSVMTTPRRLADAHRTIGEPDPKTSLRPVFDGLGDRIGTLDARNDIADPAFVPSKYDEPSNILQGGKYELERLATLWDSDAPVSDPAADMQRYFLTHRGDIAAYLTNASNAMLANRTSRWAQALGSQIQSLRVTPTLVSIVPSGVALDGQATDPAWTFSTATADEPKIRWVSDGKHLFAACDAKYTVTIVLEDRVKDRKGDLRRVPGRATVAGAHAEFRFEAQALLGAAHPGRVLSYRVIRGPASEGPVGMGFLVIVP